MKNLDRYIKTKLGEKVVMRTRSVNLTEDQLNFLNQHDLNLSAIVRDTIEKLMNEMNETKNKGGAK